MNGIAYGVLVPNAGVPGTPWPFPIAVGGQSIPVSIVAGGGGTVTIAPYNPALTTALAASLVVKGAPGNIGDVSGRIDSTAASATYYIQLWNLAALPANGTAVLAGNSLAAPIKIVHTIGTDDYFAFSAPAGGETASAGIVVGISTTEFTKTAAGNIMSASASFQ